MSRVDPEINFTWKDTNPLTGQWGDVFSARWEGYLVPPISGTYQLGVNGNSDYRLYLDGAILVENSVIHHPIFVSQEIELEAGRLYQIRMDYLNRGLDPQIQLLWSLPGTDYESNALETAKKADVIVMALGLSPRLEGEEMPVQVEGFAGGDRTDIRLPDPQEKLLKKIYALGELTVLLLMNGSAVAINWAAEHIPAIVEAWYPGQAGGEAIADVLFGDYNPSGKLPVSFYKSVADLPPFDDYELEGHTYRYFSGELLYPFGYGLSYTNFRFDELRIDRPHIEVGGEVNVSLEVTNTGQYAGDETVQLYIRQQDPFVSRPVKKLAGFSRLHLEPGERKAVTFTLHSSQFGYHEDGASYIVRPGSVELLVGNSSDHLPLSETIEVVGQAADMSANRVFFSKASQED